MIRNSQTRYYAQKLEGLATEVFPGSSNRADSISQISPSRKHKSYLAVPKRKIQRLKAKIRKQILPRSLSRSHKAPAPRQSQNPAQRWIHYRRPKVTEGRIGVTTIPRSNQTVLVMPRHDGLHFVTQEDIRDDTQ